MIWQSISPVFVSPHLDAPHLVRYYFIALVEPRLILGSFWHYLYELPWFPPEHAFYLVLLTLVLTQKAHGCVKGTASDARAENNNTRCLFLSLRYEGAKISLVAFQSSALIKTLLCVGSCGSYLTTLDMKFASLELFTVRRRKSGKPRGKVLISFLPIPQQNIIFRSPSFFTGEKFYSESREAKILRVRLDWTREISFNGFSVWKVWRISLAISRCWWLP